MLTQTAQRKGETETKCETQKRKSTHI